MSLKIQWYHNGKEISAANRIQIYHDFGYVALDILDVRADDAGVYTVVARNQLGEAQVSATMVVESMMQTNNLFEPNKANNNYLSHYNIAARSSIDTSSMHGGIYEKTKKLEDSKFVEPRYEIEEISKSKPYFVVPLADPKPVNEGKNIHLECR